MRISVVVRDMMRGTMCGKSHDVDPPAVVCSACRGWRQQLLRCWTQISVVTLGLHFRIRDWEAKWEREQAECQRAAAKADAAEARAAHWAHEAGLADVGSPIAGTASH